MRSSVSSAASGNGALGQLHIRAVLDNPKKVHHGPDDPVRGNVHVKYASSSRAGSSQLFGPLKLEVVLRGQARVNAEDEPSQITTLFTEARTLYDGAFRADGENEHALPFALDFAENVDPTTHTTMTQSGNGTWNFRQTVGSELHALPPSLESQAPENSGVTRLKAVSKVLVAVRYSILVRAKMPGIDVDVVVANPADGETVLYDQPRVPIMIASNLADNGEFYRQITVQNEHLRPAEQKPRGFVGKTKAFLKSSDLPKFVFTATCSNVPQHAFVDQPVAFDMSMAPHYSSTVHENPEVFLDSCTTSLIARTTGVKPINIETLWSRTTEFERKPFSDEHGWARTVDIGNLEWIPSTFSLGDLERTYKLRIAPQFSVGKQKLSIRQDMPVMVHPPIDPENDTTLARIHSGGSALPAYEEAAASAPTPPYEAVTGLSQPSYEQAIGAMEAEHIPTPNLVEHRPETLAAV
ncbi:uncharacterized protein MYCFIDRAFT_195943 [Pseudocercospora fijiensis CIRAD86]|uniref:Arrestin-like N-terminal domain-containing protein n=1 Tax=Pseudocercospora fijiensis (strain CIRAD86) TaxID=383855 RepID=M3AKG6_PSEFD|nr:uncharacterized protein MYCFIDRAFT_195943 [Pseudocercospora fijiensis CIRAD86]EME85076.1 hypothetical protein MYCFIDRAFT_195943 [Pseudocercospora fijiensis CIRAD86]